VAKKREREEEEKEKEIEKEMKEVGKSNQGCGSRETRDGRGEKRS
jgi:hypothetical protein